MVENGMEEMEVLRDLVLMLHPRHVPHAIVLRFTASLRGAGDVASTSASREAVLDFLKAPFLFADLLALPVRVQLAPFGIEESGFPQPVFLLIDREGPGKLHDQRKT